MYQSVRIHFRDVGDDLEWVQVRCYPDTNWARITKVSPACSHAVASTYLDKYVDMLDGATISEMFFVADEAAGTRIWTNHRIISKIEEL